MSKSAVTVRTYLHESIDQKNLFRAKLYAPNSLYIDAIIRRDMFAIESDPLPCHLAPFVEHPCGTPNLDEGYIGVRADDIGLLTYSRDMLRAASEPSAAAEERALLSLLTSK